MTVSSITHQVSWKSEVYFQATDQKSLYSQRSGRHIRQSRALNFPPEHAYVMDPRAW